MFPSTLLFFGKINRQFHLKSVPAAAWDNKLAVVCFYFYFIFFLGGEEVGSRKFRMADEMLPSLDVTLQRRTCCLGFLSPSVLASLFTNKKKRKKIPVLAFSFTLGLIRPDCAFLKGGDEL